MARLIHLNGPPGIGKSTVARAYVATRPGTLNCDVDVLRTMVGGWAEDFGRTGHLIRPAALAFISGYLGASGDVVLPQMLVDPDEVKRFAGAAESVGADYVEIMLLDEEDQAVDRFHRRGEGAAADVWHEQVRGFVAAEGGDALLRDNYAGLLSLLDLRPQIRVVTSREGAVDETLAEVETVVRAWGGPAATA